MDEKIAHLGFVQGVISRMGNNSFLIKGWAITLMAAVFALSIGDDKKILYCFFIFPVIFFWYVDAFFVYQEKLYRKLFEKIADGTELSTEFSMDGYKYKSQVSCFCKVFFSSILINFYGLMVLAIPLYLWVTKSL